MTRLRLALTAFALLAAATAGAEPVTPVRHLLLQAHDPADLRARLRAFADSAGPGLDAGEAWYHLGVSLVRGGKIDSALVAFARARAVRGDAKEAIAAIDARIARSADGDLDSAAALTASLLPTASGGFAEALRLRDAWLRGLRGDLAAARPLFDLRRSPLFRPYSTLADRPLWASRIAPLAVGAGDLQAAWRLLAPLAIETRGRDPGIARLAGSVAARLSLGTTWDRWIAAACAKADTLALGPMWTLGAKRVDVGAEGGATLAGWLATGPRGAPIAVVAAPADDDAVAACDSLLVQLHRGGLSVALFEPRGVRGSGGAAEPALLRASGQEAAQRQLAADYASVLTAVARAAGVTSPRGVFVGVGPDAMAAVLAAGRDARVRAVLLAGPEIAPEDAGWLRGSLAASGVPAFFETGPEGILENLTVDHVVAALPPAQTRVADARAPGHGAALFRGGPAEGERFAGWLSDELKRPRATPPSRPRGE